MLTEDSESLLKTGIGSPIGHRTLHQQTDPITHETAHILNGMFRQITTAEGIVYGSCQITQGVEQRPVKVENIGAIHHRFERWIMVFTLLLYLLACNSSSMVMCIRYFQRL